MPPSHYLTESLLAIELDSRLRPTYNGTNHQSSLECSQFVLYLALLLLFGRALQVLVKG